jgi:hypothetical protein
MIGLDSMIREAETVCVTSVIGFDEILLESAVFPKEAAGERKSPSSTRNRG